VSARPSACWTESPKYGLNAFNYSNNSGCRWIATMDSHYCNVLSVAMNTGPAGKTSACRVAWHSTACGRQCCPGWLAGRARTVTTTWIDALQQKRRALWWRRCILKRALRQSDRPRNPPPARSKAGTVLIEWNVSVSGRTGAQGLASVGGARLQSPKRVFFSCGCTGVGEGREYRVMWCPRHEGSHGILARAGLRRLRSMLTE
jgi:hypothetical protein